MYCIEVCLQGKWRYIPRAMTVSAAYMMVIGLMLLVGEASYGHLYQFDRADKYSVVVVPMSLSNRL